MDNRHDQLTAKVGCIILIALPFVIGGGVLIGNHFDRENRKAKESRPTPSISVASAPQTISAPPPPNPRPFDSRAAAAALPALSEGVEVLFDVDVLPGRAIIYGSTNLPPGTQLSFMVVDARETWKGERFEFPPAMCSGFVREDGTFESESLKTVDKAESARYVAEVLMPIALVQPQRTRDVIGGEGENLIGGLVEETSLGLVVRRKTTFIARP